MGSMLMRRGAEARWTSQKVPAQELWVSLGGEKPLVHRVRRSARSSR